MLLSPWSPGRDTRPILCASLALAAPAAAQTGWSERRRLHVPPDAVYEEVL